ncbi:hypothetical protein GGR50DRAFT_685447 [Xylaria sp. CBS 124048]|nr:hypothetical protein GGR50DRAFT_685447 [Xylaria sp. CBS 124048]
MGSYVPDFKRPELPPRSDGERRQSPSKPNPSKSTFGDHYNDPRASSAESLPPPPEYEEVERRKLLVIYVHGFMGNDTSFQSFPAHVHKYLKLALSDSHVVHSKIYPRYKTYKSIDVARDNFSKWLEPLENPKTDVVLVGHSMGGLLIADVVLIPSTTQGQHGFFKHRILGTVNLDSPFLGMHPGIVVSGISSLFRKNETPKLPDETYTSTGLSPGVADFPSSNLSTHSMPSTLSEMSPSPPLPPPQPFIRPALTTDPNFNTILPNDVRIEERSWWNNVVHFVKKHNSEGLIDAAANHIKSHMEFGGTMFDINSLKTRYESIRRLEDIDDLNHPESPYSPPQVRFLQYYTLCNGFPKKPKVQITEEDGKRSVSLSDTLGSHPSQLQISVGGPSLESKSATVGYNGVKAPGVANTGSERSSLELLSPEPIADESLPAMEDSLIGSEAKPVDNPDSHRDENLSTPTKLATDNKTSTTDLTSAVACLDLNLPAVPELPPKPETPDLEKYTDRDARKLVEKEAKRAQKAYEKAVKAREKAIKDREKIVEKRKKKSAEEAAKKAKEEAKEEKKKAKKDATSSSTMTEVMSPTAAVRESPSSPLGRESAEQPSALGDEASRSPAPEWTLASPDLVSERGDVKEEDKGKSKGVEKKAEKKKQRKFCNVPKYRGQVDSKWVSIFMKDMDEVAAHTGLFFAGEHYDGLVGDVGNTIVQWVQEDMTKRAIVALR